MTQPSSWFQRIVLPGLAFKAVVIGGGYATGRELVEFFLTSGPRGGLAAMLLAMIVWSTVCTATFLFARATGALDYRTFFKRLLGPFWRVFELTYVLLILLVLSVFGAAAGAIGESLLGWPTLAGTLCLVAGIALFTTFGNTSVEGLFKWVSIFLYGTYILFVVIGLSKFGGRVSTSFASSAQVSTNLWILGGLTYAGYNIAGAVIVLPVTRHLTSSLDAIKAGLLAGPLAMIPAFLFFICMCAYDPLIRAETLPSDFLLRQMNLPVFHVVFQLMIFLALLESGTGSVHALNERIASAYRRKHERELPNCARLAIAAAILTISIFFADRFGLVALIAQGYRALAYVLLLIYVLPLMTYGVWHLLSSPTARGVP
jgi:uncharacterized membrane protein YkvI